MKYKAREHPLVTAEIGDIIYVTLPKGIKQWTHLRVSSTSYAGTNRGRFYWWDDPPIPPGPVSLMAAGRVSVEEQKEDFAMNKTVNSSRVAFSSVCYKFFVPSHEIMVYTSATSFHELNAWFSGERYIFRNVSKEQRLIDTMCDLDYD